MIDHSGALVPLLLAMLLAIGSVAAQELDEEDLEEPGIWEELRPLFFRAEELFDSPDQKDSVPFLEEFIDGVEANSAFEEPNEETLRLVVQALFMTATLSLNRFEDEEVDADLRRILEIDPAYIMDRDGIASSKLVDKFEQIQRELVGRVVVVVDPLDAQISSYRWQADEENTLALPAGPQTILIERPGYASHEEEVEIQPGDAIAIEVTLERIAAVVTVLTTEPGIDIYVDSRARGRTALETESVDAAPQLKIADLQIAEYLLEARREGFRTYRTKITIERLEDWVVGPIELAPTSGTVVLRGFPAATVVLANGVIATPEFVGGPDPQLTLSPGDYLLALDHPLLGVFETTITIADRDETTVQVKLRPALAFLGALGKDRTTAEPLLAHLKESLSGLERWALVDRSNLGEEIFAEASVTTAMLRSYAQTEQQTSIRWDAVQKGAEERAKASLYVLAVLSDDVLATTAEIFIFPSAPLPSRPDVFTISISDAVSNRRFASLERSVLRRRPSIGATIVDSAVHGHPVLLQINSNGSAARAGLRPGEEILSLDGVEILSVAQFREELERRVESHAESGKTVAVGLLSSEGERTIDLAIDLSPRIVGHREPELLYAPAAYELWREAQSEDRVVQKWIIDLNLAMVYLRGHDLIRSITLLRQVSAPSDAVLGSGMTDYFLGIALQSAGEDQAENARIFFSAAAERAEGRLYFQDGPWVAPRARARLKALE